MSIIIRKAEKKDVPAMLQLVKELAQYERAPDEVTATEQSMLQDGFDTGPEERPLFYAHVAENDGKLIGAAIYYIGYSTWKGRMVYLDDIVVTESMRRSGIGLKLFDAVAHFAKEAGAHQLRWHVLDWNMTAIRFYEKLNASLDKTWITCKLTREQLAERF